MADVVGLAVRENAGAGIALLYQQALERALDEFGISHEAQKDGDAFEDPGVDVHISVRALSASTSYTNMATQFMSDGAKVVLVADAEATTPMRTKVTGGKSFKVVSGVSFKPEKFKHIGKKGDRPRPNKNVTGVRVHTESDPTTIPPTIGVNEARLAWLKTITVPPSSGPTRVGIVRRNGDACGIDERDEIVTAAALTGINVVPIDVPTNLANLLSNLQAAKSGSTPVHAFILVRHPDFQYKRDQVVSAFNDSTVRLPVIFPFVDYINATTPPGLISYGPDRIFGMEQAGRLVARLLDGAKVKDIGFVDPTVFITAISEATWTLLGTKVTNKPTKYSSYP
jgi:hypothetical protein